MTTTDFRSRAHSLDTDDLEVLILNALAENYAAAPLDHEKEAKSNVIVHGLPQALTSDDGNRESWVS